MFFKVVDTNIYIDDLKLVESVVSKEILAVPWTVIQELDGLKVDIYLGTRRKEILDLSIYYIIFFLGGGYLIVPMPSNNL